MFERSILKSLKQWADSKYRKPLILRGARQVGKTTVVNEFGKDFENYLYINLEHEEASKLFDSPLPLRTLMDMLYVYCNKAKKEGRTLLFIDEIQNSSKAVAQLRYFYEELPEIYVIAAGSLLESLIDVHVSFPVGRVEYMALRPCSFIEFLGAIAETALKQLVETASLPEAFHDRTIALFNIYTLIGGMPEVIRNYAADGDVVSLNNIYETMLEGYRDDVEKYAKGRVLPDVIRYILTEGWAFAGQSITLGCFAGSPYKAREVGEAFRTLAKTLLLELVYPATSASMPLVSDLKRSPKLLWLDTGLVNYAAGLQKEIFGASDITDAWRGMIAEQVVGQELLTLSTKVSQRRHFWVRGKAGSSAEVDFIYLYDSKIIPVEVKSGHNAKLRSIHSFMDEAPHEWAVRVWSGSYSVDEVITPKGKLFNLINIPFYYVGSLDIILSKHINQL